MDRASQEPHAPLFTLSDVLELEHYAWHDAGGDVFLFDGIMLWRTGDGSQSAVLAEDVPQDCWWHRALCTCAPCASYRSLPPA